MRHAAACLVAALITTGAQAAAQTALPPGPWVLDIRGVTSPVPTDPTYYPPLAVDLVPSRGFGVDVGAHVYLFSIGSARVGLGGNVVTVRSAATAPQPVTNDPVTGDPISAGPGQRLTLTMLMIAPQISLNFGSRDGWSYLSAGAGTASVNAEARDLLPGRQESGQLRSVNFGGGARWFIKPRLAFGFDLRAHQVAAGDTTPRVRVFAVGAGFSIR